MQNPREINLMSDYGFKPTPVPLADLPEQFRDGLLNGSLHLLVRRTCTPNRWYVVDASLPSPTTPEWRLTDDLRQLENRPSMKLFDRLARSSQVVNYGAAMNAYIPMAVTSAFADSGLPLWERYAVDATCAAKLQGRRVKAEKASHWFNRQAGQAPADITELSDAAVLLLAKAAPRAVFKLWMYRSVAGAVLELVRAGFGTVSVEGHFAPHPDKPAQAQAENARRGITLKWTKPDYILKREDQYWNNPRRIFSSFKGKKPELHYPIW